ncbi:MAG: hypothetical protein MUF10_20660, partial [Thermoanaerobaculaceae bacterium]|nr:hypothetical protein [Thermoanaerobaculaceae bacterium]
ALPVLPRPAPNLARAASSPPKAVRRTPTHTYTMGMLTEITGYASSIQCNSSPNPVLSRRAPPATIAAWTATLSESTGGG